MPLEKRNQTEAEKQICSSTRVEKTSSSLIFSLFPPTYTCLVLLQDDTDVEANNRTLETEAVGLNRQGWQESKLRIFINRVVNDEFNVRYRKLAVA